MIDQRRALKRLTFPTQNQEPISAADLALHARIRSNAAAAEASTINIYISAARGLVEAQSRKILFPSDFVLYLDYFDAESLELNYSPINSLTRIDYYDMGNVLQTVDFALYNLDLTGIAARVQLAYGRVWPYTAISRPNSVAVYYNAGYSTVPPTLKLATLLLAADFYERRQDTTELTLELIPNGVRKLIAAEYEGQYK